MLLPLYLPSVSPVAEQIHPFCLCSHPAKWSLRRGLRLESLNPYNPEAQLQVHHQALHLSLSQYKRWDPCSSARLSPPGATLWCTGVRQPWPHSLPAVHFVDTHGPPGDSALRSCQYSFGFRNQIQTNFTKNKKELMISWEVRKSPKVKPPSDMTEPSLLVSLAWIWLSFPLWVPSESFVLASLPASNSALAAWTPRSSLKSLLILVAQAYSD